MNSGSHAMMWRYHSFKMNNRCVIGSAHSVGTDVMYIVSNVNVF